MIMASMENLLKVILFLNVSGLLLGCTSYPDQMVIEKVSVKIVDYADNSYFKAGPAYDPVSIQSVEIKFSGYAPFAYMYVHDFLPQMRCYVYETETSVFNAKEFGETFFEKLLAPVGKTKGLIISDSEKMLYSSYTFGNLTAHDVPGDGTHTYLNLISTDFHHLECGLWGVKMLGPFVRSNVISISRTEFLNLYEEFLIRPKTHNVQTIKEWPIGKSMLKE